ncbi:MAG: ribulose-phosphate 3-epimerase, ribulose-phosphate 3-epimerase [Candidatus Parcubacteria bacterium]|nr:ribulose-phosphate 3-epimerase, ribulose-phosphate 3-epimerase [Candidatus Parcubacteria bacterium]
MSRAEIIPAILPNDFAEIEEKTSYLKGWVKTIQIDVCDGQFVQNATWPYRKHDDSFEKIMHEEEGFPGWDVFDFEIDLMANRPQDLVEAWVSAGAARIIIHAEATGDVAEAVNMLEGRVEVGLALNIETSLDVIEPLREKINFIQLMGIDNVGFQHQPFDEKVLGRIKEARMKFPGMPISVDGGVSLETAPELMAAGADRLVVGSAIFGSDNIIQAVEDFKALVK